MVQTERRPGRLYLPQLDVMRFFAFATVFCTHALPGVDPASHVGWGRGIALLERITQHAGSNGVGLFFLLSAFLITNLLTIERTSTGSIHLRAFYTRRVLRIWPLYYLALGIGILIQPLDPGFHLPHDKVVSAFFFFLNWDVAMRGFAWNPIFVLWTISCEEQFYALWPLMMKVLSPRRMLAGCYLTLVAVLAFAYWPAGLFVRKGATDFASIFLYFPLGGLLALTAGKSDFRWRPYMLVLWFVGGLLLWEVGGLLAAPDGMHENALFFLFLGNLIIACGTSLLFMAFFRSDGAMWPKPLIYLGKISYGLYVYHVMALDLVGTMTGRLGLRLHEGPQHSLINLATVLGIRMPLALGLTIAVAAASYRYFETPFLRWKDRFSLVHSREV